jgi:hypothetical protein
MSKKLIFFYSFLSILLFFFLVEFSSRALVSIFTKDLKIFKYGFNKNIDLQIRKLSTLSFEVINNDLLIDDENIVKKNIDQKKLIYVFGGSTSDIACIKENNTSWPNELDKINLAVNVKNFAKSGTNSDYAINSLISLYNKDLIPDIILWANYVNETDVLAFGFNRNDELNKYFKVDQFSNKILYFFKSLSKSIKNYSIFYFLVEDFFIRLSYKLNLTNNESFQNIFSKQDYQLAAKNYYLNTVDAINLAKKTNSKFYIVTLNSAEDSLSLNDINSNSQFILKKKIFFKTFKKIIDEFNEVKWINLKSLNYNENFKSHKIFCDDIHYTKLGNRIISKIINKSLNIE